jgi:hypothetical protein
MAFTFLDIPNATAALSSALQEGWPQ